MDVHKFRRIQRTYAHGSFGAFEYAFSQFESLENVEPSIIYSGNHQHDFLVNDVNRTGLYKKCVMRNGMCFLFQIIVYYQKVHSIFYIYFIFPISIFFF